jgi:hypothetical protein
MSKNNKIFLVFLLLFGFQICLSQVTSQKKDSTTNYKAIQQYSKKHKFTSFIHRLIFKKPSNKHIKSDSVQIKKAVNLEGKIIRNISIVTLDPFGYSDSDTTRTPKNWGERTGNRMHLKSKKFAIKNLLLFKKNTTYESIKIQESERLIRSQKFANRVTISSQLVGSTSDSVDVTIRVLDSWSTQPRLAFSNSKIALGIKERNFFGTGQQFDYRFINRFADGKNANELLYTVPTIKNTYIRTVLMYKVDLENYYEKSISIERPFYSPLTKWAGGLSLSQQFRKDTLQGPDLTFESQNFKYSAHDFWVGRAFQLFTGKTQEDVTTNLIVATRFLNINYPESPSDVYDPIQFFTSEKLFLVGIGINTRKYVKDSYIFKNGIIEDVPIGRIYGLTAGYQYKNSNWRPYLGGQISFGNYHDWGFLSTNFEIGTYFNGSNTEQSAISLQANYFTKLLQLGSWKIRQFIKPQIVIGLNRKETIGDALTINENYGIQGFNSAVYGTTKAVLTLQTQTYAPKEIWGFRMNPYFNYSLGVLGNSENGINKRKAYSKIGIGVVISNDYLVFSTFQLSLAYYPNIPFEGENIFRTNAFETTDFGFQDFELAKPRTIPFK